MKNRNAHFINTVIYLVFIGMFSACGTKEQSIETKSFFSLKDYFEQQIQMLEQATYPLKKSIAINDRTEQQQLDKVDYKTELAPFIDNDINRPSWMDKYVVDSLLDAGRLKTITYQALEPTLSTQKIIIQYNENQTIEHISIESENSTVLSDSERKLDYYPLKHYIISNKETTKTGDIVEVEIKGKFILE